MKPTAASFPVPASGRVKRSTARPSTTADVTESTTKYPVASRPVLTDGAVHESSIDDAVCETLTGAAPAGGSICGAERHAGGVQAR